jgi:hypothetical protein
MLGISLYAFHERLFRVEGIIFTKILVEEYDV